jgi:hypothetical protein
MKPKRRPRPSLLWHEQRWAPDDPRDRRTRERLIRDWATHTGMFICKRGDEISLYTRIRMPKRGEVGSSFRFPAGGKRLAPTGRGRRLRKQSAAGATSVSVIRK